MTLWHHKINTWLKLAKKFCELSIFSIICNVDCYSLSLLCYEIIMKSKFKKKMGLQNESNISRGRTHLKRVRISSFSVLRPFSYLRPFLYFVRFTSTRVLRTLYFHLLSNMDFLLVEKHRST